MFSRQLKPVSLCQPLLAGVQQYVNLGDWDRRTKSANDFKDALRIKMNENQDGRCIYCERPLEEISPEIEHIAPKSLYPAIQYAPINLAYACHRCNFPPHKGDEDVVDASTGNYEMWTFKLVHPYLDDPKDYFEMIGAGKCMISIKPSATPAQRKKAQYTIDMFKLNSSALTEDREKEVLYNTWSEQERRIILETSTYRKPYDSVTCES